MATPQYTPNAPGPYGLDDEIGALNLLTPDRILAASRLVRQGRVYDLDAGRFMGMPLWPGHPPLTVLGYRSPFGVAVSGDMQTYFPESTNAVHQGFNSDLIIATAHTGCHIDALAHITVGEDPRWYNGYRAAEHLGDFGPRRADASKLTPILARGVLIDMAGHRGVERLAAHEGFGAADLQAALARQGTHLGEGDVVLLRTGQMRDWPDGAKMAEVEGCGLRIDGARWLAEDMHVVAVGADTAAVEVAPTEDPAIPQPVHTYLLIERGVPLIEFVYLEELARDRAYEFFFIALPLKITGATGSMLRPVAVV
jgi:kynurenine formamidase